MPPPDSSRLLEQALSDTLPSSDAYSLIETCARRSEDRQIAGNPAWRRFAILVGDGQAMT